MKREVVFVQEVTTEFPSKGDEFSGPKLTLRMRIVSNPGSKRCWAIDVEIVRECREPFPALGGFYEPRTMREVIFFDRIPGKEEDALLARAAELSSDDVATDIMYKLYWDYILKPSLEVDYDGSAREEANWFKKHARGTWDFHTRSILRDREESVKDVQNT